MFIYLNKKAQSTAEYVIVLGLIVAAVVAMQTYVKRGLQARIKQATDFADQGAQADGVVAFDGSAQYEPYYLSSNFDSERTSTEREELKAQGEVVRTLQDGTGEGEVSKRKGTQTIGAAQATEAAK